MNQTPDNPGQVMYAIFELLNWDEIDVTFALDTVALITRDARRALEEAGVSLEDVYQIEVVRPFDGQY
jgi:hypothetical protein